MSASIGAERASIGPGTAGLPPGAAGREVTAGEYVAGLLDTATAQRVRAAMQADVAWRDAVVEWEARLAPLALLVRPEPPPGNVWDRIEARIAPTEAPRARREGRLNKIWRALAVVMTLAAIGISGYAFYPRALQPRLLTVLANDRNLPGVLVERDRRGDLLFLNVAAATGRQLQAPAGKALQVWAIASGAQAPTNLGVLPYEPRRQLTIPARTFKPADQMLIEISVEPEGGSVTGRPSGPTIFIGRLSLVAPDQ